MRKSLAEVWQRLKASPEALADWCVRQGVAKFAVYGSVLYRNFPPESDINVLVAFTPNAEPPAAGRAGFANEVSALLGRPVTVADEARLETEGLPLFRRISILGTARTLYQLPGRAAPETAELDAVEGEFIPEEP